MQKFLSAKEGGEEGKKKTKGKIEETKKLGDKFLLDTIVKSEFQFFHNFGNIKTSLLCVVL